MLGAIRDAQIMCFRPYRERIKEINKDFVKKEAVDLKREGFHQREQEAERILSMEYIPSMERKQHRLDLGNRVINTF